MYFKTKNKGYFMTLSMKNATFRFYLFFVVAIGTLKVVSYDSIMECLLCLKKNFPDKGIPLAYALCSLSGL